VNVNEFKHFAIDDTMVQVYKTYWWDSGLKGELSSGQGGQWCELSGLYDHSTTIGKNMTNLIQPPISKVSL
jgi:hypothetical protein